MAETYRSGPDEGGHPKNPFATLTHLTGAAVSLALIVGVGVWGTKLVMRDVSGIPVVRAAEGPMRVQPENPGGQPADHQGLAVNDVAGQGVAPPPPETLTLAPEDARLSDEDTPQEVAAADPVVPQPKPEAGAAEGEGEEELTLAALVEEVTAGAKPLSPLAPGEAGEGAADQAEAERPASGKEEMERAAIDATIAMALGGEDGMARSLKPRARPSGLRTAALSPVTPEEAEAAREIAPEDLASGTRLVQLGAFDSAETARQEWAKLSTRFEDYLGPKSRVIQQAQSGGKTFYRLRAHGFTDLSDARRFCAALVAEGSDCIPVVAR
ncbi:SPOR domain-containing protein [Roseivivax sp.]